MAVHPNSMKNLAKRKPRTGSKNKFTNLKESFLKAYQAKNGFGGDDALKKFAKNNPTDFLNMVKAMLPKNVEMKSESELVINIISRIPEPKPKPKATP